jgi:hypothetical protein
MEIIRQRANKNVYVIGFVLILFLGLTGVSFKSKAETGKYFAWVK